MSRMLSNRGSVALAIGHQGSAFRRKWGGGRNTPPDWRAKEVFWGELCLSPGGALPQSQLLHQAKPATCPELLP